MPSKPKWQRWHTYTDQSLALAVADKDRAIDAFFGAHGLAPLPIERRRELNTESRAMKARLAQFRQARQEMLAARKAARDAKKPARPAPEKPARQEPRQDAVWGAEIPATRARLQARAVVAVVEADYEAELDAWQA